MGWSLSMAASWKGSFAILQNARTSWVLSSVAMTRSVITFDSAISTLAFGSGGRLISSACGLRNTVVHMKKMRSRNATSTIGVMSILTPMRFGLRRLPFLCLTPDSGVSTAPIGRSSFRSQSRGSMRQRGFLAGHQLRDQTERDRIGLLHHRHDVFHRSVVGDLVRLDGDAEPGIAPALLGHDVLQIGEVRELLGILPDLVENLVLLADPDGHHV